MKTLLLDSLIRTGVIVAALVALLASVQARPEGGGDRPPHGPPPLVKALDTDRDGVISADEITAAADSLRTLDQNGDGELSHAEIRPPHLNHADRGPRDTEHPERPPLESGI